MSLLSAINGIYILDVETYATKKRDQNQLIILYRKRKEMQVELCYRFQLETDIWNVVMTGESLLSCQLLKTTNKIMNDSFIQMWETPA